MVADAIADFYPDLKSPLVASGLALVHQRYSTNTFPSWRLAQPFRFISHNGEINTLRGNLNWMKSRQGLLASDVFGEDLKRLFPILVEGDSDSAILDNAIEFLYHAGRSLPEVLMMLIPEAWQHHATMSDEKKAFYEYHACLMEPWDGPASIPFTDGRIVGAVLDRNGLRPSRYTVTRDGLVVMASETGVLDIDPANVVTKGRLQPGRMFLVDTAQGRIIEDAEIKHEVSRQRPYREWLDRNLVQLEALPEAGEGHRVSLRGHDLARVQRLYAYSTEDLKISLAPMGQKAYEAVGSMGTDTPLAVLSRNERLLYDYFHQIFAQVTNPPLDAIREELVTSQISYLGSSGNLLAETPEQCRLLRLDQPILEEADLARIRAARHPSLSVVTLPMLFPVDTAPSTLASAIGTLCAHAEQAVIEGATVLVLSDCAADAARAPIPALLAASAVHHDLVRLQLRAKTALIVESGEPRTPHHFATLLGFGVDAVCPYLALATLRELAERKLYVEVAPDEATHNFVKAIGKGVLKIMSKMGISTLQSYRGAQIFEIVGLAYEVTERYFPGTVSPVAGINLDTIAAEALKRHNAAFGAEVPRNAPLPAGGHLQWRRDGEPHLYNPETIALLQQAVRNDDEAVFRQYAERVSGEQADLFTLRGLMKFKASECVPVPLEEVEPWTDIVKRFKTGAMSYGSISRQAHETLAIAMNRIGGRSNSGEGGEDPARYRPDAQGNWRISQIKQVASGRFGVTSDYLVNCRELQIKMAQGAKPGEGGQLPAEKVYPWIAKCRHSTPYVQLISPPPHHDIYSIEDLAQLIHDLKNANPDARVSVKLVSEAGVGTVAAGVAKGKADLILISGWDGGTGASPLTSVKHGGLPWELGLAETHQTLVLNKLRQRVRLECDGKLMTGRDVAIACLLGAEEFGFATAPLVAVGCVMMRVCHLNTCPQGIATQDPALATRYTGKPEYVVNFMKFIAEDLRRVMARLGFRTLDEMVGRTDLLDANPALNHWKAHGLDYSAILRDVPVGDPSERRCTEKQDHGIAHALDVELIARCTPALEGGEPVRFAIPLRNTQRTVGTMLSSRISRHYGGEGLPDDTIHIDCTGSGGQSFGAFGARGLTLEVEGDTNDYFGKGLSGARLILYPSRRATFVPEENIICGNVALYGATSGEAYVRGVAGERFAVRNSGARAVVEGVGDHGCEYMTGGRVVVLGPTGRNFAAGMSGGVAYVLDEAGDFAQYRCNPELVDLEALDGDSERDVRELVDNHLRYTGSSVAARVLAQWDALRAKFVKIMPRDYKRALERLAQEFGGNA
jgi:glutamate synthase domain-containing protein 2/glutamate synthase domain-containing protein 3